MRNRVLCTEYSAQCSRFILLILFSILGLFYPILYSITLIPYLPSISEGNQVSAPLFGSAYSYISVSPCIISLSLSLSPYVIPYYY